ncbi:MAG: condensation domain-containing protein [Caulobacter sp.]
MTTSVPRFVAGDRHATVKSYHHGAWQGLVTGGSKADSTNGTHDLIFIEDLDAAAALEAVRALASRHPFIVGRVEERDGAPWLAPETAAAVSIETFDLRETPANLRASTGRERIGALVWRPFDPRSGPLSRFFIGRLDETLSVFGFVVHHFVCDGASVKILAREFLAFYDAARRGQAIETPPEGVGYGDYLRGMDDWMASPSGAQARQAALARMRDLPVLRFDRLETFEPEHAELQTPWSELARVARRMKTTPFTVLLAVHNLCLLSHAVGGRVATRIVTSGRDTASLLHTVGNLADRMYVIADLSGAVTFADVVDATTKALIQARAHAFVRDEFVQLDLWETGWPRDVPILNFTGDGGLPYSERYPELTVPQPAQAVTRPRDCYYMVVQTREDRISTYTRFGAGRIPGLGARLSAALAACCGTPDAKVEALRAVIDGADVA